MKVCLRKTILLSALSIFSIFSAVLYTSCSTDKCQAIVCAYGGTCKDGACICPTGYEGSNCQTLTRDRYTGTWTVIEQGTITNYSKFTLAIDAATNGNANDIVINNFYNRYKLPTVVTGTVIADTLYIPQQTMPNGDVVQGKGYYTQVGSTYGEHAQLAVYFTVVNSANAVDDFGVTNGSPATWNK
jgi:hypothetical protein